MSNAKYWFFQIVALYTMILGIREFDSATHWIPFTRGLFWMTVAGFVIWTNRKPTPTPTPLSKQEEQENE